MTEQGGGSGGDRFGSMLRWQRKVFEELAHVPETLSSLRETADNLRKVSDRLVVATEALERATRAAEETGVIDLLRRIDDASSGVRQAMGGALSGDAAPAIRQTRALLDEARSRLEQLTSKLLAGPPPLDEEPEWEPVDEDGAGGSEDDGGDEDPGEEDEAAGSG